MSNHSNGADSTIDAEIAKKITNALIVRGMSVQTLSDETGISYPTLRRSLKGGRSLTFGEFGSIARALGVESSAMLPDSLTERVPA